MTTKNVKNKSTDDKDGKVEREAAINRIYGELGDSNDFFIKTENDGCTTLHSRSDLNVVE